MKHKDLSLSGLLLLLAISPFAGILIRQDQFIYSYDIGYYHPHETVIRHSLEANDFLGWNPYFGGGAPALSYIQVGLLYPPSALARLLLPPVPFFNWDAILHVFLAGLGIYWFVRDLGSRPVAALFSAIAFMLGGSVVPRILAGHISVLRTIAWSGWLLLAYRRLLQRKGWWYLLLTAVFSSLVVLGGHPQFSLTVALLPLGFLVFTVVASPNQEKRAALFNGLLLSASAALLSGGLLAVQLIPFSEWLMHTSRWAGQSFDSLELIIRNSYDFLHFLNVFAPHIWSNIRTLPSFGREAVSFFWEISPFVGFLTVNVVILGAVVIRRKIKSLALYFAAMAAVGLIMSMGLVNPIYPIIYRDFPFIRAPGRFLLLWTFGISVLAGLYLDELLGFLSTSDHRERSRGTIRLAIAANAVIMSLAVLLAATGRPLAAYLQRTGLVVPYQESGLVSVFQLSGLILAATSAMIAILLRSALQDTFNAHRWAFLAVVILVAEMVAFTQQTVVPTAVAQQVDPHHPLAQLDIDAGEVRIPGFRMPPNYLVPTLNHVTNGEEHVALDALLAAGERGLHLLSAGYQALSEPSDDPNLDLIQQNGSAYLYRHQDSLPRVYASPTIELVTTDDTALTSVTPTAFDPSRTAVVTISPSEQLPPQLQSLATEVDVAPVVTAHYVTYQNSSLAASVVTDRPVLLVFSEIYYPGWQAAVDGQPVAIWKANYAFRGIVVGEGEHLVEMRFQPRTFQTGLLITLATMAIVIATSAFLFVRSIVRPRSP